MTHMNTIATLRRTTFALTAITLAPAPAAAQEIFAGIAAHGVNTPFSLKTGEEGSVAVQAGVRGKPMNALKAIGSPSPYAVVSVNLSGDTNFAAAGLSWHIGKTLYLRPGVGLAIHDGKIKRFTAGIGRTDLGSRILFEPELIIGYRATERLRIEATWVHISNAQILSSQNPGIDTMGLRLSYAL